MRRNVMKKIVFAILPMLLGLSGNAQNVPKPSDENIKVIARPSTDSVVLRWAPIGGNEWTLANRTGYTIERFTLVRNGKVVQPVERKQLAASPVKPLPEEQWEKFINNKYGLVAAQALYGETFELNIEHGDVMQIVNKAKENEQRYSIALFCADMSPAVAKAMGLYWSDKPVEKNVKYLYRISVYTATDTLKGSVFVDTSEKYILPSVAGVTAESTGSVVTLRWNRADYEKAYTTYSLERSEDGKTFSQITDIPGVTLSKSGKDDKYQYAVDTLTVIDKEYSYRIRGITPFGEYGPLSNIVKVKGNKTATSSVFITSALSTDNKSIDMQWEFPETENDALKGFEVTRAAKSSGPYKTIHKDILPVTARIFKDTNPQQSNYYKVKAKTKDGKEITSMPYLALLVDSIPPVIPSGLKGKVDDFGNVSISWKPNPDADILGYRIYRAYYQSEEFALMTGEVVKDTTFADRVILQSLNEKIHYQVMAIDRNQNHSALSAILSLSLPDKVPPMPAVWLPVKSTKEGVVLTWEPSGSQDVVKYEVYRKGDQGQWIRLATKASTNDSTYTYTDQNLSNSTVQYYTVVAVDEASLESPPTPVVTGFKLPGLKAAVVVNPPVVDRVNKKVTLTWLYEDQNAVSYRIYKKMNDGEELLYRTVKDKQFVDIGLTAGNKYSYSIMVVFKDGSQSKFSKSIEIVF
jgi:fibronectin type 3 domain-containing protein